MSPADVERVTLFEGALVCAQPRLGYRFAVDALALAADAYRFEAHEVLDLGTGVGIVLLLLAPLWPRARFVGIELQPELAELARANAAPVDPARIEVVTGDLRQAAQLVAPGAFDLVLSNPPYHRLGSGRLPPHAGRAVARFEVACDLPAVVNAAAHALTPAGRAEFIYPAERRGELAGAAATAGLTLTRCRSVVARPAGTSRLSLFELRRRGAAAPAAPAEEAPLVLYGPDGRYANDVARMLAALVRARTSAP